MVSLTVCQFAKVKLYSRNVTLKVFSYAGSIAYSAAELLGGLFVQTSLRPIRLAEEYIESLWKHRDPDVHAVVIGNRSFIASVLEKVI